jgi:Protein of unknown function (DUF3011)
MRKSTAVLTYVLAVLTLAPAHSLARHEQAERTVRCESSGEKPEYCRTHTTGSVELRRQLSRAPCREYDTWGADRDGSGIWVREGCRADFVVRERDWGRDGRRHRRDGEGADRDARTLRCKSFDYGYSHCPLPGRRSRDVRLVRQLSKTRCVEGDNWGVHRGGIWVDRGCEGEFEFAVRPRRRR